MTVIEDLGKGEKYGKSISMQIFGQRLIETLPSQIGVLRIPGRLIRDQLHSSPIYASIEGVPEIQAVLHEVLVHPITQHAHASAERAFAVLLDRELTDWRMLNFFNGWNETHKTTSLVSAKAIMRLSADTLSIATEKRKNYHIAIAHMYEVAKDDFGLGHEGHDGMYSYLTAAFGATSWEGPQNAIDSCNAFSRFLYEIGVACHKSPVESTEHKQSLMDSMMVSIASELWNGREYNYLNQHIEAKLRRINPRLSEDSKGLRLAKGYVTGHAGEVENRHGLHALAAAQAYGRAVDYPFDLHRLKHTMLEYNTWIDRAFCSLYEVLER